MRIGCGITVLYDALMRLGRAGEYYSDTGVMPRPTFISATTRWQSLYFLNGNAWFAATLLILQGLLAVQLIMGYRTRLALAGSLVMVWSVVTRAPLLVHGGD